MNLPVLSVVGEIVPLSGVVVEVVQEWRVVVGEQVARTTHQVVVVSV